MYNIVCFIQCIDKELPPIYYEYKKLIDTNQTNCSVIFTDKCGVFLDDAISIFSTFYIREHFLKSIILLDYKDISYISKYIKNRCIVLCGDTDLVDDTDIKNYLAVIKYTDRLKIGDILNEKI